MYRLLPLALLTLVLIGCERRSTDQGSPLPDQDSEYLLAVVIDMSGSFADQMQADNGKAYRFFLEVVDRYFRNRVGANDRLILTQLSGSGGKRALLWDGEPRALQQDFPDAKAFHAFLLKHADPSGSRVHDALADTIDYLVAYPGVASGKSHSAVFVLSDMLENSANPQQSKDRALRALATYARHRGVVGMYWVEHGLVPEWRAQLRDAGLKSFVVESDIVSRPQLPTFD